MRKYLILYIVSVFYRALAILTAITAVLWSLLIMGELVLTSENIQVSFGSWDWPLPVQALAILVIGGVLSITFYAFSLLIDLMLSNQKTAMSIEEELQKSNALNEQTNELLKQVTAVFQPMESRAPTERLQRMSNDVTQQILQRKATIAAREENEVYASPD